MSGARHDARPTLAFCGGRVCRALALMRSARLEAWPPKHLPSRCDRRWRRAIRCDGVRVVVVLGRSICAVRVTLERQGRS
jgi:hypothetical protein